MSKWEKLEEIQRLREYLRIKSVHPKPDYESCVRFLRKQASELDLPIAVHEFVPGKPVVVITLEGSKPHLPSILLNSHMDVVPVYEEFWTHPPFEAHMAEDGTIYARGIQDMKSVGMLHLEAVRRMKLSNAKLERTVHVSFVPDEEIGSQDGMKKFAESKEFDKLNVGFELDESAPHHAPDQVYVFNGERTTRQIKVTCKGSPSHGSILESGTAGEKIAYIISKFMEFRAAEKKRFDLGVPIGDVTTINLTQLEGGVQVNVLPESLSVYFDIRIAPDRNADEFEKMIDKWCKEAGKDVTYSYLIKNPISKSTSLDTPEWKAIDKLLKEMGITPQCVTCPGATDARFVRMRGIPAFSLTPVRATPLTIHAHDERMSAPEYLRAVDVMEKIVKVVANVVVNGKISAQKEFRTLSF